MRVKVKILYIGKGFPRVPQNLKKLPTQVWRLLSKRRKRQIYVGDFFTFCGALKICWFNSFRTRTGRMPELMRASIGGFRSEDKSFLAAWTAANWVALSALRAFSTMVSKPRNQNMARNWIFCCVKVEQIFKGSLDSKLWNQVPSLDHFVFQNSGDFLCWIYKEVACIYV